MILIKKVFLLLPITLTLLLLSSCKDNGDIKVTTFKYNGHTYLNMQAPNSHSKTIVHDPECRKCLDIFD